MEWSHLAAIVGYLIACYVLLIFVTVPLSVVAVALGILCAIVVALYQIGVVSFGRHAGPISTPRAVADRPLSRRRQMRFVRRDRAWPIFVASQVWLDVGAVGERCVAAIEALITGLVAWVVRTFHRVAGTKRSKRHIAWAWPVLLPLGMFALGFGAGVIMTWLLYVLVAAMAWLATQLLVVVASTAMRLTDWIWQRMYRASGSCPICYQVTSTPAFQCNGNHHPNDVRTPERYDLHFDLRPGQLGVLWRTCECGALLPTMVQRAAGQLQPFCPTCRAPMHRGAGSATDVRIPVFGAPSVGKTHLVMAGMVSLVQVAAAHQVPAEPADDYSRGQFENYRQVVDGARAVAKTPDRPPIASTLRIGSPSELSWWARARRSR
ncbi:MAG: hypothetical protein IRY92_01405, partial [Dactylosporangium sp.]|nr:hypothetical protein [Dactylosporangium sp.]